MSVILGGIEVWPQSEGFDEGCNTRGPYANVPYLCAWNDRWALTNFFAGTTGSPGLTGGWIRPNPYRYPVTFDGAAIYATNTTVRGTGDIVSSPTAEIVEWTHAIVTVSYAPLDYAVNFNDDPDFLNSLSDDPVENESLQFATQELDFSGEWINIPSASVSFSDLTKIDTPMSRRITVIRMHITWHRYPLMPMNKIAEYADSVNDATFLGRERGTVMFEGPKTTRELETDGTITQKVAMTFKWRKTDWNKFLRPDDGTWDEVIYDGDGTKFTYDYKNFRNLLLKVDPS